MTQADKELLLKDLCGRLPYGVKCKVSYNSSVINDADATLYGMDKDGFLMFDEIVGDHREFLCKPYLFPMSSMTEEQTFEIRSYLNSIEGRMIGMQGRAIYTIDWLNQHHFDHRGLIKKGLAIDATNLNVYG